MIDYVNCIWMGRFEMCDLSYFVWYIILGWFYKMISGFLSLIFNSWSPMNWFQIRINKRLIAWILSLYDFWVFNIAIPFLPPQHSILCKLRQLPSMNPKWNLRKLLNIWIKHLPLPLLINLLLCATLCLLKSDSKQRIFPVLEPSHCILISATLGFSFRSQLLKHTLLSLPIKIFLGGDWWLINVLEWWGLVRNFIWLEVTRLRSQTVECSEIRNIFSTFLRKRLVFWLFILNIIWEWLSLNNMRWTILILLRLMPLFWLDVLQFSL